MFIILMAVAAIVAFISLFVEFPKWINVCILLMCLAFALSGVPFPR